MRSELSAEIEVTPMLGDKLENECALELERIVASSSQSIRIPKWLERAYAEYLLRDLRRSSRLLGLTLALLAIGLTMLQTEFFLGALGRNDALLWAGGAVYTCSFLLVGIVAMQFERVRLRYDRFIAPLGWLILVRLAVLPYLFEHELAGRMESYFCAIGVFAVAVAVRLRLRSSALLLSTAGVVAAIAIEVFAPKPIEWRPFAYYYGSTAIVALFVAWQLESKEKTAFLQAVLLSHDTALRDELNRELRRLADHDPLTGLANRRAFADYLEREWERGRRDGTELALVFIDVDHFKAYNDLYGHVLGDECLSAVAKALGAQVRRPADLAARYGGEEFVLLLPNTSSEGAASVAHRVVEAIDALSIPHSGSSTASHISVSLGVASMVPVLGGSSKELLREADSALYRAKQSGRHRVEFAA